MFPEILRSGFWHTTNIDRFTKILQNGFLHPEPEIPSSERWGVAAGPQHYPYVRKIGGVSLFDFTNFDPVTYNNNYPLSNWRAFVPCLYKWETAIWIKFKTELLFPNLINGKALLQRWKHENATSNIMPGIEAAHIGPISNNAFDVVYHYASNKWQLVEPPYAF